MTGSYWKGASFEANILYLHGIDWTTKFVGSLANPSNIAGYDTIRLGEIWIQQNAWNDRFSLKAGQFLAETEFFTSQYSALFVNGSFGAYTPTDLNYPGFPHYPMVSPAIRWQVKPVESLTLLFGAYTEHESETQDKLSTHFTFDPENRGVLFLAEADYFASPFEHPGAYKIGIMTQNIHSGFYHEFSSGKERTTHVAIYCVMDQELRKVEGCTARNLGVFLRLYGASPEISTTDFYTDFGFNYTGLIPCRSDDIFGFGVCYTHLSQQASDISVRHGGSALGSETGLEITYKAKLSPWLYVQPDLQYTLEPGGNKSGANALILGVRSDITF